MGNDKEKASEKKSIFSFLCSLELDFDKNNAFKEENGLARFLSSGYCKAGSLSSFFYYVKMTVLVACTNSP